MKRSAVMLVRAAWAALIQFFGVARQSEHPSADFIGTLWVYRYLIRCVATRI